MDKSNETLSNEERNILDEYKIEPPSDESVDVFAYLDQCRVKAGLEPINGDKFEDTHKKMEQKDKPKKTKRVRKKAAEIGVCESGSARNERVGCVTTADICKAVRLVAAVEGKTVSTFVEELIKDSLKEKLPNAVQYVLNLTLEP